MENTLGLLENSGGGIGREVPSGGSTTGSMSTVDNLVFSSEVSSCYPDENNDSDELELGLGLSLGGGGATASLNKSLKAPSWCNNGQYARILTAKDLPSLVSKSSSSSSPTVPKANHKRIAADSVSPPNGASSQVVGWPPVRAYRMNSLNQAKLSITEDFSSIVDKSENVVANKDNNSCNKKGNDTMDKGPLKTSLFVKVNMDGTAIGRKVDLSAHNCYETLARTLEDMFCRSNRTANTRSSSYNPATHVVTAGVSLLVGYGLGWRGGRWYANRKLRKEQMKLLGQIKPKRWPLRLLRRSLTRPKSIESAVKTTEESAGKTAKALPKDAPITQAPSQPSPIIS